MSKTELVEHIIRNAELSKIEVERFLESIVLCFYKALKDEERINLVGFGSFRLISRAKRVGRNPQNGEPIDIKAKKVVRFKSGIYLSEAINKPHKNPDIKATLKIKKSTIKHK